MHLEHGRFIRVKGNIGRLALATFWQGFSQLWNGKKVGTSKIFCLPENLILTYIPWKSETINR